MHSLEEFPVVIELPVQWGEMDAFGHVNNTVYFKFFENVRIAYLDRVGFRRTATSEGVGPILASTYCRFRLPLTYPDNVRVGARVTDIKNDRFQMDYLVVSRRHQSVAAEGYGWIVTYDYEKGQKMALPEAIRTQIEELERLPDPVSGDSD